MATARFTACFSSLAQASCVGQMGEPTRVEERRRPRPRRVGPYVLSGRTLGVGRNGPVHHAISRLDGSEVAIKMVPRRAGDEREPEEVAALARVGRHPNIVMLLDTCRTAKGYDILVTEAVGGGELLELASGRVPEERARELLAGVIAGVVHMHSRGVAHRDLKLDNMLLTEAGSSHVKIIDFDVAHFDPSAAAPPGCLERGRAPLSRTCSCVCGTSSYDGKQADVWSLGVCLFALVLGIFPVEEASDENEIARHPRLPETTKDRASSPHGAQASDKDPRFEALKRAQLDRRSSALLDGMLLVDPSTRLTMADVQASRWFHTLAPGLRDDPAPPRTPAADARSFGKSFGGPLRLCLLPCGPSCEDESSLTSPKSVLDLPPSLDMVAGAGAARGADRHLLRSQSEADDEGDGDSPASAATSPPPSAFASLAATSPTSPTAPTAPASSAASPRGAE
ncbi:hypothetical protein EMIHUDRAFT_115032 [Emiliania huxleyi CCMP1516]|uniref:Protein kinase domain-containing protein n=2 Tax=Emiliania huxleyi TaxID=2903 RepID=A0A0D3JSY9_EMIH1|nr:hypothetical protein EMIHUDRAFT_115032 [Emiliania huxleyi CCMP1516]EOD26624.1 hypothetical protein EMIHUDRAFT_115032 [Emiliania huxleyi CCMP1516]|eukprot:XP_005779053.1 hypothetical protein EMIHUDRAFT_115032 [Emiliania huxleyi CCMP1516]